MLSYPHYPQRNFPAIQIFNTHQKGVVKIENGWHTTSNLQLNYLLVWSIPGPVTLGTTKCSYRTLLENPIIFLVTFILHELMNYCVLIQSFERNH